MAISVPSIPSHFPFFDKKEAETEHSMWDRIGLRKFSHWLGREGDEGSTQRGQHQNNAEEDMPGQGRRGSRRAVPGLPRPGTFRRQESERRERLLPHQPGPFERRAVSADRRRAVSSKRTASPGVPPPIPRLSASEVSVVNDGPDAGVVNDTESVVNDAEVKDGPEAELPPPFSFIDRDMDSGRSSPPPGEDLIAAELESKWILNLSMHFRDRSDREKFFVTYAETSNRWRRVTVSCDYRDAPPDSLESDLKGLEFQRDKSARIYESIRESLPDIQFYDTVTNLKLETSDARLHVHVTEDVHEVIPYPPISAIGHLKGCKQFKESSLDFDSHLSGFVYRVDIGRKIFIKKEIPGPDTVDEFLYEINALYNLQDSQSVINFGGVIVDHEEKVIKGLIISFAEQGALVDILFDMKGELPWKRRQRWAKQIVQGLSEIHEAGFVQGDFTLSNIVIDDQDNAKIIDINRRGCPVGWEPPEIDDLIKAGQRISMYIGVKSDLYQLGMVLWAIAELQEEPERQDRDSLDDFSSDIPEYYRDVVRKCLSHRPKHRVAASTLLTQFPTITAEHSRPVPHHYRNSISSRSSEKRYIDPSQAVEREDLARFGSLQALSPSNNLDPIGALHSQADPTYVNGNNGSSSPHFESSGSYVVGRTRAPTPSRGRSPNLNITQLDPVYHDTSYGYGTGTGPGGSTADSSELGAQIVPISPTGDNHRWTQVEVEGNPYLVKRDEIDFVKDHSRSLPLPPDLASDGLRGASNDGDEGQGRGQGADEEEGVTRSVGDLTPSVPSVMPLGPMTGLLAGVGSHVDDDVDLAGPRPNSREAEMWRMSLSVYERAIHGPDVEARPAPEPSTEESRPRSEGGDIKEEARPKKEKTTIHDHITPTPNDTNDTNKHSNTTHDDRTEQPSMPLPTPTPDQEQIDNVQIGHTLGHEQEQGVSTVDTTGKREPEVDAYRL
ncbi:MAG: hypothetical protein M1827_004035 [Pycnora praestabilis]|nr:MAG: hypothetical protein M1827_004035 [Pycnora praestabilis]